MTIRSLIVLAICAGNMVLWTGKTQALIVSVAEVSADIKQRETVVFVEVDNATGIAGGELIVSYNTNVMMARQVQVADLLNSAGTVFAYNLNTAGQIKISLARATGIPSGSGALAVLVFDLRPQLAPGRYTLGLQVKLWNEAGEVLPAIARDGALEIKESGSAERPIRLSVKALSFDSTEVGSISRKLIEIANTGSEPLVIPNIALIGTDLSQFQVTPRWFTIPSKGQQRITVTFAPTSVGTKLASLSVTYNATGSPATVSLDGRAVVVPHLRLSPSMLDFGSTKVGSISRKVISFVNAGSVPLKIKSLSLDGVDDSQFQVASPGFVLPSGNQRMVAISFVPTTTGSKSASLIVAHNSVGSPVIARLTGEAVEAGSLPLQVSAGSGTGSPGDTVSVPIAVSDARGIAGGELALIYDAQTLVAKEVKATELLAVAGIRSISTLGKGDTVRIAMAGARGIPRGRGALVIVVFEIKTGVPPGVYELKLQGKLWDESGKELVASFNNGKVTIAGTSGKPVARNAEAVFLFGLSNFPNPFNGTTQICYQLMEKGQVRVAVHNLLGQRVRLLVDHVAEPGLYQVQWDGQGEVGEEVTSGVYLCLFQVKGWRQVHSMVLLR